MKQGFTLIELLAVIAILAIIMIIAAPKVLDTIDNVKNSAYYSNEQMMKKAAETYLSANQDLIPEKIGDIKVIELTDLKTEEFISEIKDIESNNCSGYLTVVKKTDGTLKYNPYLNCGDKYQTYEEYNKINLILDLSGYDAPLAGYWEDRTPNNFNAKLLNGLTYDQQQKGYVFDGINDYASIPWNILFDTGENNAFTYSVTFKAKDASKEQNLLTKTHPCSNNGHFNFRIFDNRTYFFFYSNLDAQDGYHYSEQKIENNKIHNVVWSKKWGELGIKVYLDGLEIINYQDVSHRGTDYDLPIFIGARNGKPNVCNSSPYPYNFFEGIIYDIKIYNRRLSEDEIRTNFSFFKNKYGI